VEELRGKKDEGAILSRSALLGRRKKEGKQDRLVNVGVQIFFDQGRVAKKKKGQNGERQAVIPTVIATDRKKKGERRTVFRLPNPEDKVQEGKATVLDNF